jgi:hypothetical protein
MRTPHFKEVPEHWRAPFGPYYQAPPEHGSEWWLLTPFSTSEPWLYEDWKPSEKDEKLPEGFEKLFGPRPKFEDYRNIRGGHRAYQVATVQWEQELRYFKGTGTPEWASAAQVREAEEVYVAWRLGRPTFYESRYGWMGRFVESEIEDYDSAAWQIINYPHHVVAQFQITNFQRGNVPHEWHPFVPPTVFLGPEEGQKEIERRLADSAV